MIKKNTMKNIIENVINQEIKGLEQLKNTFEIEKFEELVNKISFMTGKVIIAGIGKSGHIAQKIAASMCSIGKPSVFLHLTEASHGDLGMISSNDIVIILSNSGEGLEITRTINYCRNLRIFVVGISRDQTSYLISHADMSIVLPMTPEASNLDIPTTSSTMMLVFGDVLTIALKEVSSLTQDQYITYHPGGKIGMKGMQVKDVMITKDRLPIIHYKASILSTAVEISLKKLGFTIVIDDDGGMLGIVFAEAIKNNDKIAFDCMSNEYKIISGNLKIGNIIEDLSQYKYLIVLQDGKPEGVLFDELIHFQTNL